MSIPLPEIGLVIRYNYLWRDEASAGRDQSKARPACLIAAIKEENEQSTKVVLLPITHTEPSSDTPAIEVPDRVKAHLGLDEERTWVVLNECNVDRWPSPDLSPIPSRHGGYAYGYLPPRFFEQAKAIFVKAVRNKKLAMVQRK